ncbi:MAG: hypothetical protein JSV03_04540 [Planctomycetota bacterium]|nr:MAG: hypothetical protein JSV03_04540 [Planctomycetota bacterium]
MDLSCAADKLAAHVSKRIISDWFFCFETSFVFLVNVMTWELYLARPLLILHALTGFAALGISLHVLYFAWRGGGFGRTGFRARARRYANITWPIYLATIITGALVYPAYMVDVRGRWLDANRPELTGLFEIKEHWAAIGLILSWAMWRYLCRSGVDEIASAEPHFWRGHALLTFLMVICIAVNVVIGCWVVMVKSV